MQEPEKRKSEIDLACVALAIGLALVGVMYLLDGLANLIDEIIEFLIL